MHKINWWRVASVALLAASALLGFGHDVIEDQKTEDELRDMVQEEVRRQLAEKNNTDCREKFSLLYGRKSKLNK